MNKVDIHTSAFIHFYKILCDQASNEEEKEYFQSAAMLAVDLARNDEIKAAIEDITTIENKVLQ